MDAFADAARAVLADAGFAPVGAAEHGLETWSLEDTVARLSGSMGRVDFSFPEGTFDEGEALDDFWMNFSGGRHPRGDEASVMWQPGEELEAAVSRMEALAQAKGFHPAHGR